MAKADQQIKQIRKQVTASIKRWGREVVITYPSTLEGGEQVVVAKGIPQAQQPGLSPPWVDEGGMNAGNNDPVSVLFPFDSVDDPARLEGCILDLSMSRKYRVSRSFPLTLGEFTIAISCNLSDEGAV